MGVQPGEHFFPANKPIDFLQVAQEISQAISSAYRIISFKFVERKL